MYINSLRAYPSTYGEITHQDHLKLFVGCKMEQDSVSQIMYRIEHRDNSSITGSGRFPTFMHFYTSSSFAYKVWKSRVHPCKGWVLSKYIPQERRFIYFYLPQTQVTQVPYEVLLNQELFVQAEMEKKDRSLVLFIDTCVASPSPHDFQTRAYYLVRNG